jgi:tetratricopeptide (TPR) repeat protein
MLPDSTTPPEPTPEELMFRQAVEAIRTEQFAQAREILTNLLRVDQQNPDYWVWLSAAMETQKERLYCLQTAFEMDPTNNAARRGLVMLGVLAPDSSVQPFPMNHPRPWESKVKLTEEKDKPSRLKQMTSSPAFRLGGVIGLGVLVLIGAAIGMTVLTPKQVVVVEVGLTGTPRPTVTPYATNSNSNLGGGTQATALPLAALLSITYTPTPVYAATPHGEAAGDSYKGAMRAYKNGQWDNVAIMMAQVATAQPGSADAVYFIGEANRLSGKYQQAIDNYTLAIKINANFSPSYLGRARAGLHLPAPKNVLLDLNQAIILDPNYAEAYLERGLYYFSKYDLPAARADLEQSASLSASPLVEINLARVLLAQGENPAALAAAKRANELDLTMLDGYLVLGMAYRANGQLDQAVYVLETYLKYQPDNAQAFEVLGAAYFNRGEYELAKKNLQQAVRMDTSNWEAYFYLGQTSMILKDYPSAMENFLHARDNNPDSFVVGEGLANAYMAIGEFNNAYMAVNKVEKLITTDAERARFLYIRALSLDDLKSLDAAYRDWSEILSLPIDATTEEMRKQAQLRTVEMRSPTPIPPTATSTNTPLPTATRPPTRTPKPTETRMPTSTPKK